MKSVLVRSTVVLVVLAAVAFAFFRPKSEGFFPRLGQEPLSPRKLESLLKKSEEQLTQNPNNVKSMVDRGVAYYWMGPDHYADAYNSLTSAYQKGAFDHRIFYYLGILNENLSLFPEAEVQYERFLNHEPNDREIKLRLARLLFRMKKWDDSVARYQVLIEQNPNDVTSIINCGLAYQQKAEALSQKKERLKEEEKTEMQAASAQAISYFERAAKIQPDLPEGVNFALAKLYYLGGNWREAAARFTVHLEKNPGDPVALEMTAASYEKLDQKDKALEYYSKWSAAAPQNPNPRRKVRALKKLLNIK